MYRLEQIQTIPKAKEEVFGFFPMLTILSNSHPNL